MIERLHSQGPSGRRVARCCSILLFSSPTRQHGKHPTRCVDMGFHVEWDAAVTGIDEQSHPRLIGPEIVQAPPLARMPGIVFFFRIMRSVFPPNVHECLCGQPEI
jgi:hypothetical protein